MLLASSGAHGRQNHVPLAEALVRLWAAGRHFARAVELFALLAGAATGPSLWRRSPGRLWPLANQPPHCPSNAPRPLLRAKCSRAFGLLNEARPPFPGREGVFF